MDLEEVVAHCRSLPGVTEETPFGPDVLTYKVCGKLFALTNPSDVPAAVNLKGDPDRSCELRDRYPAIRPGYHMNKRHWNTVRLDGSLPSPLVRELIDRSYALVVAGLKKADRQRLGRE